MSQDMVIAFFGIMFGLFLLTSMGAGLHWIIKKTTEEDTPKITHDSPHTQPPFSVANSREDLEHLDPENTYEEHEREWRENYYGKRGGRSRDL